MMGKCFASYFSDYLTLNAEESSRNAVISKENAEKAVNLE